VISLDEGAQLSDALSEDEPSSGAKNEVRQS